MAKSELDKKISAFEKSRAPKNDGKGLMTGGTTSRAGYELLIAIGFFSLIGFALDTQLSTLPWLTLLFFFLGFATGVYNAWRAMNTNSEKVGTIREKYAKTPAPQKKQENEESENDEDGDGNKPFGAA